MVDAGVQIPLDALGNVFSTGAITLIGPILCIREGTEPSRNSQGVTVGSYAGLLNQNGP